ncbi:MAG: ribonuclease III domain-containing protein [Porphyromonas sp.]|nr:ribonuclease III domain-containing protein [Porphyromonas sp.]
MTLSLNKKWSCRRWFGGAKTNQEADKTISLFIKELIGKEPDDLQLYVQALTHKSYRGAEGECEAPPHNERLEFLGDAVLSSIVGTALYMMYPEEPEGVLTNRRSHLVNRNHLNGVASRLGLEGYLFYDETSLELSGSNALGNALEALVGAIYLDQGYRQAERFVKKHIVVSKDNVKRVYYQEEDYKTEFIILMQRQKIPYRFVHLDSRPHPKYNILHRSEIQVGSPFQRLTVGVGTNKKIAHQNAAKDALKYFEKCPEMLKRLSKKED